MGAGQCHLPGGPASPCLKSGIVGCSPTEPKDDLYGGLSATNFRRG